MQLNSFNLSILYLEFIESQIKRYGLSGCEPQILKDKISDIIKACKRCDRDTIQNGLYDYWEEM